MASFLDDFDETIHAPRRLAVCAFLAAVDAAEFSSVKESLGISDSSLSKQVSILAEIGYVASSKSRGPGRARTWLRLTPKGRAAFESHVDNLKRVLILDAEK